MITYMIMFPRTLVRHLTYHMIYRQKKSKTYTIMATQLCVISTKNSLLVNLYLAYAIM